MGLRRITFANKGFTLIELLIVVAILGIIASIAYPSYQSSVFKGRRADAIAALSNAVALQENISMQNGAYTSTTTDLWAGSASANSYYTMTIPEINEAACGGDPCFKLTATATGQQSGDSSCASFSLDSQGNKTASGADCWPD